MKTFSWFPVLLIFFQSSAQSVKSPVKIIGAMKNVMWQGELQGKIFLDTIKEKRHLYGMGPSEFLNAELLIVDGRSYRSSVLTDNTMQVEETYNSKAPFFGYVNIERWMEENIPGKTKTLKELEQYLEVKTRNRSGPFFFRLSGMVSEAKIHIVNLPPGTTVKSPGDAHTGRVFYSLRNEEVDIIGFFSTAHQAVFTHHDTFLHMHLISSDKKKMGHLDELLFDPGKMKLFLPAD